MNDDKIQKEDKTRNYKKRTALLLIAFVGIASYGLVNFLGGSFYWETPVPRAFPAVPLHIAKDVQKVVLHLEPQSTGTNFQLAKSDGAVRDFWVFLPDPKDSAQMTSCQGTGAGEQVAASPRECVKMGSRIDITPATGDPKDAKGQQAGTNGRIERTNKLWLVPYYQSTFASIHPSQSLRWSKVELRLVNGAEISVTAENCANPSAEDRDRCLRVEDFFGGRPHLTFARNPDSVVSTIARGAVVRTIPTIVTAMLIGDALLAVFVAGLLGVWIRGGGLVPRSTRGIIIDANEVWAGPRRFLRWIDTMWPSAGMALTTIGLTLAFDRTIFAERDGVAFSSAISFSMVATFAGLIGRMAAQTAEYMIEELAHWNAAPNGLIYPSESRGQIEPSSTDDTDASRADKAASKADRALAKEVSPHA